MLVYSNTSLFLVAVGQLLIVLLSDVVFQLTDI